MKSKIFLSAIFLLFIFVLGNKSYAFIEIEVVNKNELLRSSITVIPMPNKNTEASEQFKEVFDKYWTFSKIKYVSYSEFKSYEKTPGYSCFKFYGYTSSEKGNRLFFSLWLNEVKNKKKNKGCREIRIAKVSLYVDHALQKNPQNVYREDYDLGGRVKNWTPGFLKNYLMIIQNYLKKKKIRRYFKPIVIKKNLQKLKNSALYLPDYVLVRPVINSSPVIDENGKELMKEYKGEYNILSSKELSDKILNTDEEFYYLIHVNIYTEKYIAIIEAKSGEILYYVKRAMSYSINYKDFLSIRKEMNK